MQSLRVKILLMAALLVVFTQAGTIGTVLLTADREVERNAGQKLTAAAAVLERALKLRAIQMQNSLRLLMEDQAFMQVIRTGEPRTLNAQLARTSDQTDADVAFLLDANGVVRGAGGRAQIPDTLPSAVRRSMIDGDRLAIVAADARVYQAASVPMPLTGNGVQEWLSLGMALDDSRARRISQLVGLQVIFTADTASGPRVSGSSLGKVEDHLIANQPSTTRDDLPAVFELQIQERNYLAIQRPLLPQVRGAHVLLLESVESATAPYRVVRVAVVILGVLALIAGLTGGALVARTITRPVRDLVRAATRIRNGDYSMAVKVAADDELGMLASAFNTMQGGIAERESRITYQAQYDSLTGLPNRLLAVSRLEQAVRRAHAAGGEAVSVLMVDLGSFGDITASLGHEIGDTLLAQAAEKLRAAIDARHTVARLEGDKFLVILDDTGLERARERGEDLLQTLGGGLSMGEVNISLNAVVGIAVYPEHSTEHDQLLLRAMVAQNDARAAQQRLHVYQHGREERRVRQLAILGDLRRAVRRDELKLYLQPKIDLTDGRVCGAEALVRWDHPTLGWLGPGEFIGVAEQFGNISLITHWALEASIRECRLWVEEGIDISVSVNLSSRDLLDQNLPAFIQQMLRDHDLSPRHLTLEITEEALVKDFGHASLVLQALRDLGARISIDDFGTGYSSLAQIKKLPVDELKIDRSFIMELPQDRADAAIVRAAIDLAHSLQLTVVAEGVETSAALRWLGAHGCEMAQGFLISRPMAAEAFSEWVHRFHEAQSTQMEATLSVMRVGQAS